MKIYQAVATVAALALPVAAWVPSTPDDDAETAVGMASPPMLTAVL